MTSSRREARWRQVIKGNAPWQTRPSLEQYEDNPGFYAPTYTKYRIWLVRTREDRFLNLPPPHQVVGKLIA